jgi:rare lipoprotein A
MERYHPSGPASAARALDAPLLPAGDDPWRRQVRRERRRRQTAALAGLLAGAALVSAACSGNHKPVSPANSLSANRGTASWYGPKFDGRRTASGERYDMHSLTAAHPSLPFGTLVQVTNLGNGRQVVVRINDRGPFGRRRVIDLSYAAARQLKIVGPGTAEVQLAVLGPGEPAAPQPPPTLLAAAGVGAPTVAAGGAEGGVEGGVEADAVDAPGSAPSPAAPAAPAALAVPAASTLTASSASASQVVPAVAMRASTAQALHYTVQVGAFGEPERADALQQSLARLYPETAVHSDGTWYRVQVGLFADREQAEWLRRELAALGLEAVVVGAH